ncbi:FAD-dependent oxidoreductase [Streptomyces sp. NPDC047070]|uniref:FAD-dependent oxidoreductase n=1 Tax=Streptomyces sp. NPDC047070 TaxID=3154923 RepID=UPI003454531F
MTFVITQSCCNDTSCVAACPVQCIRPRPGDPGFTTTEQLYIDPATCIDCGACAAECPVDAIVHETDLPARLEEFRGINADYFAEHPLGDTSPPLLVRRRLPREQPRLTVAVVGSGPAALYAAAELSEIRGVEVTVVERLSEPYGLVRFGVAPDHGRTRLMTERFAPVLRRPNVTCLFGVEAGRDVSVEDLLRHHHAVIWATGAFADRALEVPGEDLEGSVSARDFVAWYNGHPDFTDRRFDLSGRRAVVIGNGNVALDIARLLTQPATVYEHTPISPHALRALRASAVEEVVVVARRGPAQAAYGTAELLALAHLPEVDLLALPGETSTAGPGPDSADGSSLDLRRRLDAVRKAAARTPTRSRRITLRYSLAPAELTGDTAVTGVLLKRSDGTTEKIDTGLVVRAIGFRGLPAAGLPFDPVTGTVPDRAGRVVDPSTQTPLPGLYCTGWIRRGPSGTIGTNRTDAAETVASLLDDCAQGRLPTPAAPSAVLAAHFGKTSRGTVAGRPSQ